MVIEQLTFVLPSLVHFAFSSFYYLSTKMMTILASLLMCPEKVHYIQCSWINFKMSQDWWDEMQLFSSQFKVKCFDMAWFRTVSQLNVLFAIDCFSFVNCVYWIFWCFPYVAVFVWCIMFHVKRKFEEVVNTKHCCYLSTNGRNQWENPCNFSMKYTYSVFVVVGGDGNCLNCKS